MKLGLASTHWLVFASDWQFTLRYLILTHTFVFSGHKRQKGGWGGDYRLRSHSFWFSTGHWLSISSAIVRLGDKK